MAALCTAVDFPMACEGRVPTNIWEVHSTRTRTCAILILLEIAVVISPSLAMIHLGLIR